MNPWLNYHHLYYFKVIATEGSIAKASEKLRLGQPTLSAQLKVLEENLGVRLFERKHKRLILTETGRIALEYANEIFRTGNEMLEVLQDRLPAARPHVQIGALDSVPKSVVAQLVQTALDAAPCTVSILEGKGDELLRELSLHRIDLFVSNYPPSVHEAVGMYVKSVGRSPVIVCGASQFKSVKKDFPASIHQKPFVMPTVHSKLRHDLDHYLKGMQVVVDCVAETQDVSLQRLLGVNGIGLIPVPRVALQEMQEDDLVELGELPGVFEEYYLVSASRKIENPISSKVLKSFSIRL